MGASNPVVVLAVEKRIEATRGERGQPEKVGEKGSRRCRERYAIPGNIFRRLFYFILIIYLFYFFRRNFSLEELSIRYENTRKSVHAYRSGVRVYSSLAERNWI